MAKDTTNYSYCPLRTGFFLCVKHSINKSYQNPYIRWCISTQAIGKAPGLLGNMRQCTKEITNRWLKVSRLFLTITSFSTADTQYIKEVSKMFLVRSDQSDISSIRLDSFILQAAPRREHFCLEAVLWISPYTSEQTERKSKITYRKWKTNCYVSGEENHTKKIQTQ